MNSFRDVGFLCLSSFNENRNVEKEYRLKIRPHMIVEIQFENSGSAEMKLNKETNNNLTQKMLKLPFLCIILIKIRTLYLIIWLCDKNNCRKAIFSVCLVLKTKNKGLSHGYRIIFITILFHTGRGEGAMEKGKNW